MTEWATDTERGDGLVVYTVDGERWVIQAGKAAPVELCPCCDKPFLTAQAARRVADRMYQPEPPMAA